MNNKLKIIYTVISIGAAIGLLSSCDGILGSRYDAPEEDVEFGFIRFDSETSSGTIYIDASSYTKWTYLNLDTRTIDTTYINKNGSEDGNVPSAWHIAVHRYDAKTNGGSVLQTEYSDPALLVSSGIMPEGEFKEDILTTDKIAIDMSGMMDGNIIYAPSSYNEELSRWLNVDTSQMPPIYTMSGKVYLLRVSDGRHAAIILRDYMNDAKVKGFMTIDYVFPVDLK